MSGLALEQTTRARTLTLLRFAAEHFGIRLPEPEVRFDLHGKAAGMAVFYAKRKQVIRYNQRMLAENGLAFIEQTVPHEVAHLVARVIYGNRIRPHGKEWRAVMKLFNAEPVRCHNFSTPQGNRRRMRYFAYRCACSAHQLSAIRHNRTLAGATYLCRRCGTALKQHQTADA
jgi:SprT protein